MGRVDWRSGRAISCTQLWATCKVPMMELIFVSGSPGSSIIAGLGNKREDRWRITVDLRN